MAYEETIMKTIQTKLNKQDKSKWVALSPDNKILAENTDPTKIISLMKKKKDEYILQYVPEPKRSYIFFNDYLLN